MILVWYKLDVVEEINLNVNKLRCIRIVLQQKKFS